MATTHSKIKRATSHLRSYLDYNQDEYKKAAKHIRDGEGWVIKDQSNANRLYNIVSSIEGTTR